MTNNITSTELNLLFPEKEVTLAGKQFTIRPFSFVQTREVARKLKGSLHLFNGDLSAEMLGVIYDDSFDGIVDIILMTYQGLDRETVEQFDMKNAMIAIKEIIEINKDFFTVQVMPLLNQMMEEKEKQGRSRKR